MGKGNAAVKQWMSNKARFADLFNGIIFRGEQVVQPSDLEMISGESDILISDKRNKSKEIQRYRDITMKWKDRGRLTILACENQSKVHYAMPVRNMLYDSLAYTEQIKQLWDEVSSKEKGLAQEEFLSHFRKEDRIVPVITLVFYYDVKKWDGNIDLYEMFGLREKKALLQKYIPNYYINLVDAGNMENIDCFRTDLQEIFGMLQCRNKKEQLLEYMKKNENYFRNVDQETYYALREFLHSERLLKKEVKMKNVEERIDMCKALEDLYNDGVENSKIEVAKNLMDLLDIDTIAERVGLPLELVQKLKGAENS